jgi:hypothetical protein
MALFLSSTRGAHKGINAVVVAQTGTLLGLAPFTNALAPTTAALLAGGAALLFAILRRYERNVVLQLTLSGNGQTVEIETTRWYGAGQKTTLPVSAFVSCSAPWPVPDKRWWLAATVDNGDGRLRRLLFESFSGNVSNVSLFNRLLSGQLAPKPRVPSKQVSRKT